MQIKAPDIKEYKIETAAFFIYLIIALVMFWNITGSISSVVPNGGGDVYQSLWGLWWVPFSVFALHQSPYITQFLFYPIGANLVSQTMVPLSGIATAPLQALVGLVATYNILFFLSFALGGLFMFLLARYLVKNNYAAFIAGLIFAFSPMHIAQSYSHLQWTIIEFIPLFILCFLLLVRTKEKRYAVYSAISFILLAFMGDIEQAIIMVVFVIASVIIMLAIERREVLNRHFVFNMGILAVLVLVIGSPFFISIGQNLSGGLSSAGQLSDVVHNMLYSDNLASFFLPSYYNGIFHGAALGYVNTVYGMTYQGLQYTPDITEKVSYLGYSVILLVLLALYHEHRKNKMRDIIYWIAILIVFALFALGPNIQILNWSSGVPTLYSAYRAVPLFNLVREPGRFDVVITVAVAALAAIGFDHLSKSRYGKNALALAVVFSVLILIEYNGMPLSGGFAGSLVTNAQIPQAYGQLGKVAGNFSVLVLPALPNLATGSFLYPGMAMYYQTSFGKPLFGGYTTRTNSSQQQILENVPLVVSAAYLQSGNGFIFPYPIEEDYSNLTLFWLSAYRVGFVAVINSAYNQSELGNVVSYLYSIFGNPVYQDGNVTVFSSGNIENLLGGKSIVSYIVGGWVPGYEFCTSSVQCNQTLATTWFGQNVRAITIFSPNSTAIKIRFRGMSYYPQSPVYLFLNNQNSPLAELNFTASLSNYSLTANIPVGLSQITFYQSNSTQVATGQNEYLNFGLRNITIGR